LGTVPSFGVLKLAPWHLVQLLSAVAADERPDVLGRGLGQRGRRRAAFLQAELAVVGGEVGDVLLGERVGNGAHGGVLAVAALVGGERGRDVRGALARDHGHLVDLGEAGLVADDAVATHAHLYLLCPVLGLARDLLGFSRDRHASDSKGKHRGQQLVHFARTISWRVQFFESTFDYMQGSPDPCAGQP
jgi:hypothetical protein